MSKNKFTKGSIIHKWGDLDWNIETAEYIFIGDTATPVKSFHQMTFSGLQRLLLEGQLRVAVEC